MAVSGARLCSTTAAPARESGRRGPALALHLSPAPLALAPAAPARPERDDAALCALVERIRAGDLVAFERLYQLTRDDVARTLRRLVGPRADLEDLIQETYLQLLKAARTFRGESQFRTFLYRVCANVACSHLRWWRRRPEEPLGELPEPIAPGRSPEDEAELRQAAALVGKALDRLTAKKRIVFVYHELCGMGPEEIAAIVGSSPNTVRSRLHHARLEFQTAMTRLLDPRAPGRSR